MLKTTAILLNIIFLGFWIRLAIKEGFSGAEDWEILMILMIFLVPIINLLALTFGKDNWITLYFKRKAMEEKRRISEIAEKIEKT